MGNGFQQEMKCTTCAFAFNMWSLHAQFEIDHFSLKAEKQLCLIFHRVFTAMSCNTPIQAVEGLLEFTYFVCPGTYFHLVEVHVETSRTR
jgi:hypothetical protein